MILKLLDTAFCRTPIFSSCDKLALKWSEFKSILLDSSPEFYDVIVKTDPPSSEKIKNKVDFTIWKYFNRAKYRATPYGRFAAFSTLKISTHNSPIVLNDQLEEHYFTDWNEKDIHISDLDVVLKNSDCFFINTTLYTVRQEHRFIRLVNGVFELSIVKGFQELDAVLKLCTLKKKKHEIFDLMNTSFGLKNADTCRLLSQMLSIQIINTEYYSNITGDDYFKRLKLAQLNPKNSYIISERKLISGHFSSAPVKNIPGLIKFLSNALPDTENELLKNFRLLFLKKFNQRFIPLMLALDTELGIGYGEFAHRADEDQLIELLTAKKDQKNTDLKITYSQIHKFLLNGFIKGDTVRLEEFEDKNELSRQVLPNSLSVQIKMSNGNPIIENIGGCTANALLGRFTLASSKLEDLTKEIREIEEQANSSVIFFEIAYQAENNVDNINRRKRSYAAELPILSWSCNADPIVMSDIYVGVIGSEIVLWSRKFNKRMIPRLSSAYNYNRSDLSVYRFLCDLQHQGLKSNLNLKTQYFFPGLKHYPKVVYKDIIVSPASWQVPKNIYEFLKSDTPDSKQEELQKWLDDNGIDFPFKAGSGDQLLYFDPRLRIDIEAFFHFCIQQINQEEVRIFEALTDESLQVVNHKGEHYAAEFILSYSHFEPVYKEFAVTLPSILEDHSKHVIYPGAEWLYVEIYCHPIRIDEILTNQIKTLLETNDIQKWFFIRYNDPSSHLRVRIKLKDELNVYPMMTQLMQLLAPQCKSGAVSDVQVKTYFQETDRYGIERIDFAEDFFSEDSYLILRILAKSPKLSKRYKSTLALMDRFIRLCFKDHKKEVAFVGTMAEIFTQEFKIDSWQFKTINSSFKKIEKENKTGKRFNSPKLTQKHRDAFSFVLQKCDTEEQKAKMLADFLHLHINRLFISDQRAYEAVLYHYLLKIMKMRRATSSLRFESLSGG